MRRLLLFLVLLLTCCQHRPHPLPDSGLVLGWRLAAGMELRYRYRTEYRVGPDVVERLETWRYLVRDADERGFYTLEAQLDALDASIQHAGKALEQSSMDAALAKERERLSLAPLHLALSMDGRMDRLGGGNWTDTLHHRMLALGLPRHPVATGEHWPDPATARPFSELIPSGEVVDFAGTHEMQDLRWIPQRSPSWLPSRLRRHRLVAVITTTAAVLPQDSRYPALEINGHAYWDPEAGQLERRVIQVQERAGDTHHEGTRFLIEAQRLD